VGGRRLYRYRPSANKSTFEISGIGELPFRPPDSAQRSPRWRYRIPDSTYLASKPANGLYGFSVEP